MKLFYSRGACSLSVRITLYELDVKCDFESVNLKTKQTESEKDFLLTNPKGAVPTLVLDNKEILTENVAILIYLAEKYNGSKLFPQENMKHYRVIEWLSFIASDLHKTCGSLFNPNLSEDIKSSVFKPQLKQKLSYIERHLSKNKYLVDDQFSLADSYLFVILSWLKSFKLDINHWPTVAKYHAELKKRPSIIQALQEEGLVNA